MLLDSLELDDKVPLLWVTGEERSVPLQLSTEAFLSFWSVPVPGKSAKNINNSGNETEVTSVSDDVKEDDKPFQSLQRKKDTVSYIIRSLEHIREFHRDLPKREKTEKGKLSNNQRRLRALGHQQERLQKQLSDDPKDADPIDASWLVLVKILNSLSIITPVILGLCFHERRNDDTLKIQGTHISIKGNTPTCWMIGDKNFDICKTHTRGLLLRHLAMAFELIDVDASELTLESNVWKEKLRSVMTTIVSKDPSNFISETEESIEFRALLQSKRGISKDLLQKLDIKYGLIKEKDEVKHQKYLAAIQKLHSSISAVVKKVYPDAVLTIYGSCLSDLSLGKNSDVDISLHISESQKLNDLFERGKLTPAFYEKEVKKTVFKVSRSLEARRKDFREIDPVAWARVPVIRGTFINAKNPYSTDGSIDFDICFLNDIAVANSSLLREYSLVDPRAKHLMFAVKKWAKEKKIASARDNTYSSYTWMCLVVFYLQHIGLVPNLQDSNLMAKVGAIRDEANQMHSVNNLDTFYATWEQVSTVWSSPESVAGISVSELLHGFYQFYLQFPKLFVISMKRSSTTLLPKTLFRKCFFGFAIEDPFETYDSHMPHDLGKHAQEPGMRLIMQNLKDSEKFARECLTKALNGEEGDEETLWPVNLFVPPKNEKNKKRERKGRNRNNNSLAEYESKQTEEKSGKSNDRIEVRKSDASEQEQTQKNVLPAEEKPSKAHSENKVEMAKSVKKKDDAKLDRSETKLEPGKGKQVADGCGENGAENKPIGGRGEAKQGESNEDSKEGKSSPDDGKKESDMSGQEDRCRRLYVGNLSWGVNWQTLKDLMKSHDLDAIRIDVKMTPDGKSKGCAIVEFATGDDARKAVLTLNNYELGGRQMFLREDREDRTGGPGGSFNSTRAFSSDQNAKSRRVYVGNLARDVAWQDLKDFCKQAGKVVHAEIIKEQDGLRSKGYGIVEFATVEEAQEAINTLTDTDFRGRMVLVREDRDVSHQNVGQASLAPNTSVVVRNLSPETTWYQLKDYMRKAGNVDSVSIDTHASKGPTKIGVVLYQRPQEASRAIRELNDSELMGCQISVREFRFHSGGRGAGGRGFGGRGDFKSQVKPAKDKSSKAHSENKAEIGKIMKRKDEAKLKLDGMETKKSKHQKPRGGKGGQVANGGGENGADNKPHGGKREAKRGEFKSVAAGIEGKDSSKGAIQKQNKSASDKMPSEKDHSKDKRVKRLRGGNKEKAK